MDLHNLRPWYGKHAKGISLSQVCLRCERQAFNVLKALYVFGLDITLGKLFSIIWDRFKHAPESCLQSFKLDLFSFFYRHAFRFSIPYHLVLSFLISSSLKKRRLSF